MFLEVVESPAFSHFDAFAHQYVSEHQVQIRSPHTCCRISVSLSELGRHERATEDVACVIAVLVSFKWRRGLVYGIV